MIRRAPLCLVALALFLGACATEQGYDGPVRARCDVARLVIHSYGSFFGGPGDVRFDGRFRSVDGQPVGAGKTIVDVLPGSRQVEVQWNRYEAPGSFLDDAVSRRGVWVRTDGGCRTFRVEAEAGKRYVLRWPFADQGGGPKRILRGLSRRLARLLDVMTLPDLAHEPGQDAPRQPPTRDAQDGAGYDVAWPVFRAVYAAHDHQ